jgi:hypothetical protein
MSGSYLLKSNAFFIAGSGQPVVEAPRTIERFIDGSFLSIDR